MTRVMLAALAVLLLCLAGCGNDSPSPDPAAADPAAVVQDALNKTGNSIPVTRAASQRATGPVISPTPPEGGGRTQSLGNLPGANAVQPTQGQGTSPVRPQ